MDRELVSMVFSRYRLKKQTTLEQVIEMLWKQNLINVGELAEQAIAKNSDLMQNSRGNKGSDFSDWSDSKYVTVYHDKSSSYGSISGFGNKVGTLRVCCHEPKTGRNYYFLIPRRVYRKYLKAGKNDSLKIWFNRDGSPRKPKSSKRPDLWLYEVSQKQWAAKIKR